MSMLFSAFYRFVSPGYDGGDCCSCTCDESTSPFNSCNSGFACIDPRAPCVDDDDITIDFLENCSDVSRLLPRVRAPLNIGRNCTRAVEQTLCGLLICESKGKAQLDAYLGWL